MQVSIIINTQAEGIHNWPECDIKEVSFLKYPHRHIFHICCKKTVNHSDRDIEIIKLKREINDYLISYNGQFNNLSCEMICEILLSKFGLNYCSVLEDGENGAEIHI